MSDTAVGQIQCPFQTTWIILNSQHSIIHAKHKQMPDDKSSAESEAEAFAV
jgi:hypothetical protein